MESTAINEITKKQPAKGDIVEIIEASLGLPEDISYKDIGIIIDINTPYEGYCTLVVRGKVIHLSLADIKCIEEENNNSCIFTPEEEKIMHNYKSTTGLAITNLQDTIYVLESEINTLQCKLQDTTRTVTHFANNSTSHLMNRAVILHNKYKTFQTRPDNDHRQIICGDTTPITIDYTPTITKYNKFKGRYELGTYEVSININTKEIRIHAIERTSITISNIHPHISRDRNICFGSYKPPIRKALDEHDYIKAFQLIHDFLSSVTDKDWYIPIMNWSTEWENYCPECTELYDDCLCDTCEYCEEHVDDCTCTYCPDSGERLREGIFPEDECVDCSSYITRDDGTVFCDYTTASGSDLTT